MPKKEKKTKSQKRWDEINARKSKRYAKVGRQMEGRVKILLDQLVQGGVLVRATRHKSRSRADYEGRDFTVGKYLESGEYAERSFGITTSARSWSTDKLSAGEIPQFHFPLEIKDETVVSKVLNLFEGT